MLKFAFWILLLANLVLFAYRQASPEALGPGREPSRMNNQMNADKVKLIQGARPGATGKAAETLAAPAAPAAAPAAPAAAAPVAQAGAADCTEIGNFRPAEARRFAARLAGLSLQDKLAQRSFEEAGSHIVYIPPLENREAAERKAEELRNLGVHELYVIQDDPNLKWAVSLGVFKAEDSARAHLAELARRGVQGARVGPFGAASTVTAFQLRALDAETKAQVARVKDDFPKQEMRACG